MNLSSRERNQATGVRYCAQLFTEIGEDMPTTAPRPASIDSPLRFGRRLLGSSLVDALTAPHGVDRYIEQVRPASTLHDPRARVIDVRRQTADSVTLTLRPNYA